MDYDKLLTEFVEGLIELAKEKEDAAFYNAESGSFKEGVYRGVAEGLRTAVSKLAMLEKKYKVELEQS